MKRRFEDQQNPKASEMARFIKRHSIKLTAIKAAADFLTNRPPLGNIFFVYAEEKGCLPVVKIIRFIILIVVIINCVCAQFSLQSIHSRTLNNLFYFLL